MEDIITNIVYITIISYSESCYNSNFFNFANLCYYVCLITLINVSKYVRKENNELVKETISGETGVIFWSAVYLSGQD